MENEVADVHLNVPWAQQAEKKSQVDGDQDKPLLVKKRVALASFIIRLNFHNWHIWCRRAVVA